MELAAGMLSGVQIQQMIEENEQRKRMDYKNGGITLPQTQFVGPGNRVVDSDNKSNFNSLTDNCLDWVALEHDVDYHNIGSTDNTQIPNVEKLDNKAIDNAWRECKLSQPISTAVLVRGLKTKQHIEDLAVYTDTSAPCLCLVELMEFRSVCTSWTDLSSNIPPNIGTSFLPIKSTSTSPICVPTERTPAAAVGSVEDYFTVDTDSVDFVGFLEGSIYEQPIGEASVDTYLRAADASTELVASAKMRVYVIDINIYRYVIKRKMLNLRDNYINSEIKNINKAVGFKLLKTKDYLDDTNHDD